VIDPIRDSREPLNLLFTFIAMFVFVFLLLLYLVQAGLLPRSMSCLSGSRAGFVSFPQVDDLRLWKSGFSSRMDVMQGAVWHVVEDCRSLSCDAARRALFS
jgi:hypothetical protein